MIAELEPVEIKHTFAAGGIVFCEGLPGSGKTTFSQNIHLRIQEAGLASRWISELELPHPIFGRRMEREMDPAVWEPQQFMQESLAGWRALAEQIRASASVVVLEATLLQVCAGKLQQMDVDLAVIQAYLSQVYEALHGIPSVLIYLWQENPQDAIRAIFDKRGQKFKDDHERGLPQFPYLSRRNICDQAHLLDYAATYEALLWRLLRKSPFTYRRIDTSDRHWPRIEDQVFTVLGLQKPSIQKDQLQAFTGRFRCKTLGQVARIQMSEGELQIKIGKLRRHLVYSPATADTLYVSKYPHRLIWSSKNQVPHLFSCEGPADDSWNNTVWQRQIPWFQRLMRRWQKPESRIQKTHDISR